jgi:hypothetical protein
MTYIASSECPFGKVKTSCYPGFSMMNLQYSERYPDRFVLGVIAEQAESREVVGGAVRIVRSP